MPGDPPRRPRRPSLKDIAAEAGVSFQTVSKVLRGRGTVTPATRARIHAAADALGYVPDEVARSLVTQRTSTLGVVVGDLGDHVLARFVAGAEREARRQGHAVVIVNLEPDTTGHRSVSALLRRRVDGIVLAAPQLEEDERLAELVRTVPSAAIHSVAGGDLPLVGSSQTSIGRTATAHLLDLGHRAVATITGPHARRAARSRLRGWSGALATVGLEPDDDLVVEGDWSPSSGYAALRRLLDRRVEVTAVFAHSDLMAAGALHALADAGRAVPDDVAVIGCDDIPIAAHTIPPLSTVHVPFAETGAAAVRSLLARIDGTGDGASPELLPTTLVCRRSCGCDRVTAERP